MNTKTIPNPKAVPEDSQLVKELLALSGKSSKRALVKSSTYDAPADPEIKVRSWKMDEYKYYDVPSPFPSLVRGLFTVDLPGHEQQYRIVARGYDKFFNIGEVPWTSVRCPSPKDLCGSADALIHSGRLLRTIQPRLTRSLSNQMVASSSSAP